MLIAPNLQKGAKPCKKKHKKTATKKAGYKLKRLLGPFYGHL
jgi:hypothetical protein